MTFSISISSATRTLSRFGLIGLVLLGGCDESEDTRNLVVANPPAAEEKRKRDTVFAYENRILAEWKGERKEGSSVWRCEIFDNIANVPTWAKNFGSGGGGSPFTCRGAYWVVIEFADETQIGFLFPLSEKKVRSMRGQIRRYPKAPKSKLHDSIGEDGLMQRTWFDFETSDLSDPYWNSNFKVEATEPQAGWSRIDPGLGLFVAVLEASDTEPNLVWPYLPGLSEQRSETPTILRVITRVVPDETEATTPNRQFEDLSITNLVRSWKSKQ